jgi:hypothetical protein
MISRFTALLLVITSLVFSKDSKVGIEAGIGIGISNEIYYPIPTVSFCLLREKGINQISAELLVNNNYSEKAEYRSQFVFGIGYSFLFKLPINFLYFGPSLGFHVYSTDKSVRNSFYGTSPYIDYPEYIYESTSAIYVLGPAAAIILGTGTFRFKIDDRLLLGIESEKRQYLLLNNINVSIMLAI